MSDNCELDEHGNCKNHGAGTEGEAELITKMIATTDKAVSKLMLELTSIGETLSLFGNMVEMSNRMVGRQPLRNIEKELEAIILPLIEAGVETVAQIRALNGDHTPPPRREDYAPAPAGDANN